MNIEGRRARFRKSVVLLGILVLLSPIPALSQDTQTKPRIAVLPLKSVDVSASVVQSVTSLIETALVRTKAYTVVSTTDRDQVMKAQETALAGCDDAACAVQIGRLLSAQQIVVGNVSTLGRKIIINARIIDISSSQILGAESTSATTVEDLEQACSQLTKALVASAMPSAKIAQTAPATTTEKKPAEPATTTPAAGTPAVESKPGTPLVPEPGEFDFLSFAAMSGGILLMEAGNVFGPMSFETMRTSGILYGKYMEASTNFDALYAEYASAYTSSAIFGISSYALLGLGAGGVAAGTFLFPAQNYRLSPLGKITFSAGLAASVSGSVLSLMAGNQDYTNAILYDKYMNASVDFDARYLEYQNGYTAYSIERIAGYSLWGAGGAAMAGSFLLPGEKTPVVDSLLNKILYSCGMALVAGGGFLQPMALNARQISEENYKIYMKASTNFDALYANYTASYGNYTMLSGLSYGLLAGGAAATIVSVFVPFGGPAAQAAADMPLYISVVPSWDGIGVLIHYAPRRS